ncbi:MarR family transcriptional regulator [Bacillus sp. NP157]|nr:MarR family transcriptional regulator [Bacillus sp. NP157]
MTPDPRTLKKLFANVSLGAPENAVGFVLWRVVHRYQREIDRVLAPLDLTHLQFTTLAMAAWLCQSNGPTTQTAVAQAAEIHPMQVSLMLKALEAKGMIVRERSTSDVRAKVIRMTSAGVAALRRAMPLAIKVQVDMFGDEGAVGGGLLETLNRVEHRARQSDDS